MAELDKTPEKLKDASSSEEGQSRSKTWIFVVAGVVFLALVVLAVVGLMNASTETTTRIRDVFIIFMALETLVIGVALVVLTVQLSALINLLQNEIRPILESTREAVNDVKGTAQFLGDNFASPVIKASGYMAGVRRFIELLSPWKK